MDKKNIKNIVFDFGDIFINLDKPATLLRMKKLGLKELSPELVKMNESYEKGLISTSHFVQYYHHLFPQVEKEELVQAWNAIILDFPEYRLNFLEKLANKKNFRLFLLSNTNELHISAVKNSMSDTKYERFKSYFEKFYLSHEIHLRKPDLEIFNFVIQENGLNPQQTLFVDDTLENVLAAKEAGWKGWHLIPGEEDIINLLDKNFF
ncbi:HAD-IA family hydrolase [Ascidiimonas sp. W6]|uniref:HAD family hydrolase n=1 Tax=Ascidiimonas meishanensis TaxID=3128903 RepID=UPI0030EC131B